MPPDPPPEAPTPPPDDPLVQCNVRIPRSLIAAVDARRAVVRGGMTRDRWVENALRYVLDQTVTSRPMGRNPRTAPPPHRRP